MLDPFFLKCGLDPVTVAATETHLAFWSTLTSTIVVMIFSLINYQYAFLTLVLAIIGAVIGINF